MTIETTAASEAVTTLHYTQIRIDGGTQMRAAVNEQTAGEYADELRRGATLPPVVVFFDGTDYWLGDGFHRVRAYHMAAGSDAQIPAEVRPGTRGDAVLCAAGANAVHGLRRTRADKERAVDALLRDEEWGQWSDREISRKCHVSPTFVGERRKLTVHVDSENGEQASTERTYTTRHGTVATMNVAGQRAVADELHQHRVETWLMGRRWSFQRGPDGTFAASKWIDGEYVTIDGATQAAVVADAERREKAAQENAQPSYVSVWTLERAVSDALAGFWRSDETPDIAGNLRTLMRLHDWEEIGLGKAIIRSVGNLVYRKRDLVQAINNVRSQAEQRPPDGSLTNNTDRPAINLPADLVTAAAGRCWIRPYDDEFMATYVDKGGTTQANWPTVDEAVAWLRKKVAGPAPGIAGSPAPVAAQQKDDDDRIMIACPKCGVEQQDLDGFGVLHCEACGYCVHPSATGDVCDICGAPHPAHVRRSQAILAEVEFWRDAGNRVEKVGELTGQYTVVAPLRRAIEEIVRVLSKELEGKE